MYLDKYTTTRVCRVRERARESIINITRPLYFLLGRRCTGRHRREMIARHGAPRVSRPQSHRAAYTRRQSIFGFQHAKSSPANTTYLCAHTRAQDFVSQFFIYFFPSSNFRALIPRSLSRISANAVATPHGHLDCLRTVTHKRISKSSSAPIKHKVSITLG